MRHVTTKTWNNSVGEKEQRRSRTVTFKTSTPKGGRGLERIIKTKEM